VLAAAPGLRYRVRANRAFLGRATRYLAAEPGLRQFLDIGTGIRPPATRTRWRSASPRMPAWSTSTTTIASWVVHTRAWLFRLPEANTRGKRAQSVPERFRRARSAETRSQSVGQVLSVACRARRDDLVR
jgi:S-adenosyl methyltransferase